MPGEGALVLASPDRRLRVLMLVATSVSTDTRVLREATALVGAGAQVHIVGRSVPAGFVPPDGMTVSSVGTSSVFRGEGQPSLGSQRRSRWRRVVRWALLPQHRNSAFGRWAKGALQDARAREYDVVHAHDFTALQLGAQLAADRDVPLVYDSHELWSGRPRGHRPTPMQDWRERRVERTLGRRAAAVITVGDGVADALRARHGWDHVVVVRNTFAAQAPRTDPAARGAVYAGRLARHRELEVIADASRRLPLPVILIGPSDDTWLAGFDPRGAVLRPPISADEVTTLLREQGVALVTHDDTYPNLRLALPNKVFQAVSAGVPVVATDVGELARLVREYHLGTLYRIGDSADLVRAMTSLVGDYPAWCQRVVAAQGVLDWSADGATLVAVYATLAGSAGVHSGKLPP